MVDIADLRYILTLLSPETFGKTDWPILAATGMNW